MVFLLLSAIASTNAQTNEDMDKIDMTSWPQLDKAYHVPQLNSTGNFIAAVIDGGLQVWSVAKPEKIVWNSLSSHKNSYVINFDWWGNDLVFSVIDSPTPITKELLDIYHSEEGQQEFDNFLRSTGRTLRLDIESGKTSVILNTAYKILKTDIKGNFFATQIPTTNSGNTDLNFYRLTNSAEKVGTCPDIGQVFIFSWDRNSTGVFVLASVKSNVSFARQSLLFIDLTGKSTVLLKDNVSIAHPIIFSPSTKEGQDLHLYVKYFDQLESIISIDTQEIKERTRLHEAKLLLRNEAKSLQLIAVSPNQRLFLFQNSPVSAADFDPSKHGDIWIVDLSDKKIRKITKTGLVFGTSRWAQSKIVVGTGTSEENALRNWVFYFPGAE